MLKAEGVDGITPINFGTDMSKLDAWVQPHFESCFANVVEESYVFAARSALGGAVDPEDVRVLDLVHAVVHPGFRRGYFFHHRAFDDRETQTCTVDLDAAEAVNFGFLVSVDKETCGLFFEGVCR